MVDSFSMLNWFLLFICKAPAILCWNFRMWIQCVVSMGFYDAIKRIIGSGQTIVLRKKCTLGSHLIILTIFLSWYKNIGSSINKISYPLQTALQTFVAKFPPEKMQTGLNLVSITELLQFVRDIIALCIRARLVGRSIFSMVFQVKELLVAAVAVWNLFLVATHGETISGSTILLLCGYANITN